MSGSGTEKAHESTPNVLVLVVREVAMVSSWGRENVVVSMLVSALKPATQPCPTWGLLPLETDTPSNKGITAERTISGEAPQVRRMPRYMSSFEVGLN